ncbi:endonuclease MutS2 [Vallitaleaceae bacterium 9-2]
MNKAMLETLEFYKILENIEGFAIADEAKAIIRKITPTTDYERIEQQMEETTQARNILNASTSIPLLGNNHIEQLLIKVEKNGILQPEELESMYHMMVTTDKMKRFMQEQQFLAPTITAYALSMYEYKEIKEEINRCIYQHRVDDKASPNLGKIRKQKQIVEGRMKTKLETMTSSAKIKKYLQDNTVTMKNNRYVLQVKANYKQMIPGTIVEKSTTGSTYFVEPIAISRYQEELQQLVVEEEQEIYQILAYLTALIYEQMVGIKITLETFITYDVIFAKAKYSQSINARSVKLNTDNRIHIVQGRHPLLGHEAVALDFDIGVGYQGLVITGPNTGGKTVALKTVGLFTAMVQSGIHVPVDEGSEFAIYGQILVDIGDGQSIEQSLSTFSAHIQQIIRILKSANPYSLVILDEIGSGTDPVEGEGLAIAILEKLYEQGATILATSHYGQVKTFAKEHVGFINGKMDFDVVSLQPTYQLIMGEAGESNAFVIALRLGMEEQLIQRAHIKTYNKPYQRFESHNISAPKQIVTGIKAKKPKTIKAIDAKVTEDDNKRLASQENIQIRPYQQGDQVEIASMHAKGIVYEQENHKQEVTVLVKDKKVTLHRRMLTLKIAAEQLYPEGYDFDILFKSKAYRKNNKLMSRKYVKNQSYEIDPNDL